MPFQLFLGEVGTRPSKSLEGVVIERLAGNSGKRTGPSLQRVSSVSRCGMGRSIGTSRLRGSVLSRWSRIFPTECELFTLEWNLR